MRKNWPGDCDLIIQSQNARGLLWRVGVSRKQITEFRACGFVNCNNQPAHDIVEHGDVFFGKAGAIDDEQVCDTPHDRCPLAQVLLCDGILEFVDQCLRKSWH